MRCGPVLNDVNEQQDLVDQLRSPKLFSNEDYSAAIPQALRLTSEMVRAATSLIRNPVT